MMEWYEKTVFGNQYDTWHAGRFMDEWLDKDTHMQLSKTFGRYDAGDSWRALLSTTELFSKLSKEVALKMQYAQPTSLETYVTGWIKMQAPNEGKLGMDMEG